MIICSRQMLLRISDREGDAWGMLRVWWREEVHRGIWWRNLKERNSSECLGVDRKIILKWIFKQISLEGLDWIDLAQDTAKWRSVVNTVMDRRISQNEGNSFIGEKVLAFQAGLSFVELFSYLRSEVICKTMQCFRVTLLWVNIRLDIRMDRRN